MFSSVAQSCLTLGLHKPQHTRPPCPSPTPGVYPNSCPLNTLENITKIKARYHFKLTRMTKLKRLGFLWWLSGKESACQCRRHELSPWSRKIIHAVEQLSLRVTTIQPEVCSPGTTRTEACMPQNLFSTTRGQCNEKPAHCNNEEPLLATTYRKHLWSKEDPAE